MKLSKKVKLLTAVGLATATLTSCSNTQMAATGLALAGTMAAYGAYNWVSSADAETALDSESTTVFKDVQKVINGNSIYHITSTTVGEKQSQIIAATNGKEVKVVVEDIGNNQSKIYIKDGRGKDQATILINEIVKAVN